jgi:response regulator RpfG family c-di-GMP phosphodiesterase
MDSETAHDLPRTDSPVEAGARQSQAPWPCYSESQIPTPLSGDDVFREIRRIKSGSRVLLTSGFDEQDAMRHFTANGLAGFIQEPYQPDSLSSKMREILDS